MDENKGRLLMHVEQLNCYWKQLFKHTSTHKQN